MDRLQLGIDIVDGRVQGGIVASRVGEWHGGGRGVSSTPDYQGAIRDTIDRLRAIMLNIDNLFGDAEKLLQERGFYRLHTGFQSEQSKAQAVLSVPQYLTVFYAKQEGDEAEDAPTICLSIFLANRLGQAVDPQLTCFVFEPRDRSNRFLSWWARVSLTDTTDPGHLDGLPVDVLTRVPKTSAKAKYWFKQCYYFAMPLTQVKDVESLRIAIDRLCDLYFSLTSARDDGPGAA